MDETPAEASGIPTPAEAAQDALARGAKDMAHDAVMRRVHRFMRTKLPRPIYNLLFRGVSAEDVAKDEVRRRVRSLMWGCGFTAVFGAVAGAVLLFVVVAVGLAIATSL